eukprot:764542-Hanusia_phi.AAC.2
MREQTWTARRSHKMPRMQLQQRSQCAETMRWEGAGAEEQRENPPSRARRLLPSQASSSRSCLHTLAEICGKGLIARFRQGPPQKASERAGARGADFWWRRDVEHGSDEAEVRSEEGRH